MFTPATRATALPATTPPNGVIDLDTLGLAGTEPIRTAIIENPGGGYRTVIGPSSQRKWNATDLPAGKWLYFLIWNEATDDASDAHKWNHSLVVRPDGTIGWQRGTNGPYATYSKIG